MSVICLSVCLLWVFPYMYVCYGCPYMYVCYGCLYMYVCYGCLYMYVFKDQGGIPIKINIFKNTLQPNDQFIGIGGDAIVGRPTIASLQKNHHKPRSNHKIITTHHKSLQKFSKTSKTPRVPPSLLFSHTLTSSYLSIHRYTLAKVLYQKVFKAYPFICFT